MLHPMTCYHHGSYTFTDKIVYDRAPDGMQNFFLCPLLKSFLLGQHILSLHYKIHFPIRKKSRLKEPWIHNLAAKCNNWSLWNLFSDVPLISWSEKACNLKQNFPSPHWGKQIYECLYWMKRYSQCVELGWGERKCRVGLRLLMSKAGLVKGHQIPAALTTDLGAPHHWAAIHAHHNGNATCVPLDNENKFASWGKKTSHSRAINCTRERQHFQWASPYSGHSDPVTTHVAVRMWTPQTLFPWYGAAKL